MSTDSIEISYTIAQRAIERVERKLKEPSPINKANTQ